MKLKNSLYFVYSSIIGTIALFGQDLKHFKQAEQVFRSLPSKTIFSTPLLKENLF
ncbi:MAG: hypothetical protein BAJALOKI3v1_780027 [Promethearchaeota archaeon]|nr:MAG: hypothetical protein BAJALOKI3v1_780027 [Candidatus Lokiarchaeota archaeon]